MLRRANGFTLIELLIVVVIVGILAALLIPQALGAIQKAKQKGTMQDINVIAKAVTDYITDKGAAPAPSPGGPINNTWATSLQGFYLKSVPFNDQWGTPFQVFIGTAMVNPTGWSSITMTGSDDFVIGSFGRDGTTGPFNYQPQVPSTAFFTVSNMAAFNYDLVNWNGSWVQAPKAGQQ